MTSLLGQEVQTRTLFDAARGGRMHHGWILAGPRGVGKASFARLVAQQMLAEAAGATQSNEISGDESASSNSRLFDAGTHPDYAELVRLEKDSGDLARNISVDQVRGLQRLLGCVPSLSDKRIIVIDSADDMERGAANALLKNLEEPPAGTIFLLVSHAPARLLPTIRSRCRILRFAPLGESAMQVVLRRHLADDVSSEELDILVKMGEGSPGRALNYAGLDLGSIERTLMAILTEGDTTNSRRLGLAKRLSVKAARPQYQAFLERVPALLATVARSAQGRQLKALLVAWEQARQLASGAIILSLDPATVIFELCGHLASVPVEHRAA